MFFDKLNPLAFFIALAVGLFFCYITQPTPKMVVKFPSPQNAGKLQYRNTETDSCFKFDAEKVQCPADKTLIKPQPIVEDSSSIFGI